MMYRCSSLCVPLLSVQIGWGWRLSIHLINDRLQTKINYILCNKRLLPSFWDEKVAAGRMIVFHSIVVSVDCSDWTEQHLSISVHKVHERRDVNSSYCISCRTKFWVLATKLCKGGGGLYKKPSALCAWPCMTGCVTCWPSPMRPGPKDMVKYMSDDCLSKYGVQFRLWNIRVTFHVGGFIPLGKQDLSKFLNRSWIPILPNNICPLRMEIILRTI